MKKVKQILTWLFIAVYTIVIFGFVNKENDQIKCKSIKIKVVDKTENYFIEEEDVLEILQDKGTNLIGEATINIDRNKLEQTIDLNPTIQNAQVYFTHKGVLHIDITQKKPIVRIINRDEESYYIDEDGFLMPLSDKFSAHVIIANGYINEPYHNYYRANIMSDSDSLQNKSEVLRGIYQLADFITSDEFWNAQIQQIYFSKKGEIELVPRVGTHIILFGNMENYIKKFTKLRAVYDFGFKEYGWNKYRMINLKYENQVICTKK